MQVNRNEEASAAKTNRRRKCGLRIAECGIERRPSARTEEPQTKREEKPTAKLNDLKYQHRRRKCGLRIAELNAAHWNGLRTLPRFRKNLPHSAIRNPHFLRGSLRYCSL
jgi:hypothetical protein